MSIVKYTPQNQIKAVALRTININNSKRKAIEEGETFLVQEYEFFTSDRGNPEGTSTIQYFVGTPFELTFSSPTMNVGTFLKKDVDFSFASSEEKPQTASLSNNNTVVLLAVIVIAYFGFKFIKK